MLRLGHIFHGTIAVFYDQPQITMLRFQLQDLLITECALISLLFRTKQRFF